MPTDWWNEITGRVLGWLTSEGDRSNLLRHLLILLLLALVAQQAAKLVWSLAEGPGIPPISLTDLRQQAMKKGSLSPEADRDFGENLASLHLFGEPESVLVKKPSTPVDVPETTLDLTLRGVIAATPMRKAVAVISRPGGQGKYGVYLVGEEVPGRARIKAIYPDRVILERGGKLETLFLEDADKEKKKNFAGSSVKEGEHRRINREYLTRKMDNVPELAREVGVEISYRNGEQYGYKLVSAGNSKFLKNLGLQPGDILYEVNGIRLANASKAMSAYKKLQDSREIWLEIERNGQRQTKTYSIR